MTKDALQIIFNKVKMPLFVECFHSTLEIREHPVHLAGPPKVLSLDWSPSWDNFATMTESIRFLDGYYIYELTEGEPVMTEDLDELVEAFVQICSSTYYNEGAQNLGDLFFDALYQQNLVATPSALISEDDLFSKLKTAGLFKKSWDPARTSPAKLEELERCLLLLNQDERLLKSVDVYVAYKIANYMLSGHPV